MSLHIIIVKQFQETKLLWIVLKETHNCMNLPIQFQDKMFRKWLKIFSSLKKLVVKEKSLNMKKDICLEAWFQCVH